MWRRALLAVSAVVVVTVLVTRARGEAPRAPTPPAPPQPVAPRRGAIPVDPGATVVTTCEQDLVHVSICSDPGHCTEALTADCVPYGCDAAHKWCRSSCTSTVDCSLGSACDTATAKCAMMPNQCADPFTVIVGGQQTVSCAPYRCAGGQCQEICHADADCAGSYHCDSHMVCVR